MRTASEMIRISSARISSRRLDGDADVDLDLDPALGRQPRAEALQRHVQRLVGGRDQGLDRAARILERALGGVHDLDPVGQLGQAAGTAADEGEFLRDAVVQLACEPAAFTFDPGLCALADVAADFTEDRAEEDAPGGDAKQVAEVDVVRPQRREEGVVQLGHTGEDDRDGHPAQQRLLAAGEADGRGDEGGGGHELDDHTADLRAVGRPVGVRSAHRGPDAGEERGERGDHEAERPRAE